MPYQVAYDVLEDGYHVGFAWVGVPLGVLILVLAALRRRPGGKGAWPQATLGHPWAGVVAGGLVVAVFTAVVGVTIWDQLVCRRQAQRGDCPTAEGVVAGFDKTATHSHFTVAGVPFQYHRRSPGFRGRYTDPALPARFLKDGLRVRILYCGENILRIEYLPP